MTLPKYALDYERCTYTQIHRFCKARGLPITKRKSYNHPRTILTLLQADLDATFPFSDLEPAIRKLIYEQLLTFSADSGCHPQILATASWVWDEASTILYEENVLNITVDKQTEDVQLSAWRYPDPSTAWDLVSCDQIGKLPVLHNLFWDARRTDFAFYFKRFRLVLDTAEFAEHLAITTNGILGDVASELQTFDRLAASLFAIAAFLQNCTGMQELVVDMRGCFTEKYRNKVIDAMLPLARLWGRAECKFYGFYTSDCIETIFAETANTNAPLYATPIYRKAWLLQKEMVCFDLLSKAGISDRTLSKYRSAKSEIAEASKFSFRDAADEWLFNSSLEFLGRVFTNVYEDEALCPPGAKAGSWRSLAMDFEHAHTARVEELEGEEGTTRWA